MEILGSHVYEKFGVYMAPLSLFCTIFNHLDWESFARIANERKLLSDSGDITNELVRIAEEGKSLSDSGDVTN